MTTTTTPATTTRRFYVYVLLDPRTPDKLTPYYVGKGSGNRYRDHFHTSPSKIRQNGFKYNVTSAIRKAGLEPAITFYPEMDEQTAFRIEAWLIGLLGRRDIDPGGVLTNRKTGGSGHGTGSHSGSTKAQMSASKRGVKRDPFSAEWKSRMGESRRGKKNGMYGKVSPCRGRRNPQHPRATTWTLKTPDGTLHQTDSLKAFCLETFGSMGKATSIRNTLKTQEAVKKGVCTGWIIQNKTEVKNEVKL